MKTLLIGCFFGLLIRPVLAQQGVPAQPVVGDSVSRNVSPAVRPMGTGFYRRPGDPRDVMRATLDNMPVKSPRPDVEYSMMNPYRRSPYHYRMPLPGSEPWPYRPRR